MADIDPALSNLHFSESPVLFRSSLCVLGKRYSMIRLACPPFYFLADRQQRIAGVYLCKCIRRLRVRCAFREITRHHFACADADCSAPLPFRKSRRQQFPVLRQKKKNQTETQTKRIENNNESQWTEISTGEKKKITRALTSTKQTRRCSEEVIFPLPHRPFMLPKQKLIVRQQRSS